MPMCQAIGCTNRPDLNVGEKKSFFAIPNPLTDRERCSKWLNIIKTNKFEITTYKYAKYRQVCEDHFEQECFKVDRYAQLMGYQPTRKLLKPDAVPTIFVHRSKLKPTKRQKTKRRSKPYNQRNHTDMEPMENVNLNAIEEAAERVKGRIHVTPVMTCGMLNKMADGRNLFFKCELLQKTGSFKIRGALNAVTKLIDSLPDGHEKPKVVTHSSGNFGQALAYAAQLKGLDAYVVMPETSPQCKVNAVKGYGAEVIMCKPTEESRRTTGEEVQRRTGAHFFSPSQTYDVISGQGTIGLELLDQIADLDAVIVPVGGGGMIAGIATALKNRNPAIKVFAAEPENADDCFKSFQAKKLIPLPPGPVNTVADGLRVSIGQSTWPIIEHYVDDVITVTENEIKDATRNIWQFMKLFIEPSAGVGVAAALSPKFSLKAKELKNVAVILCGGNVDVDAVKHWL